MLSQFATGLDNLLLIEGGVFMGDPAGDFMEHTVPTYQAAAV
jgi:hypothetical protein